MSGPGLGPALDAIHRMLTGVTSSADRHFPPTELFSEGWMLRLALSAAESGVECMPFAFKEGASWYSEARLGSPFMRRPGDRQPKLAEGFTHADCVVGQLLFREGTEAGLHLQPTATQFVVAEAKMGSGLSRGTTNAPGYDQAARNVACMAWTIEISGVELAALEQVAFYVIAPQRTLDDHPHLRSFVDGEGIIKKVSDRVQSYRSDPERRAQLDRWFVQTFQPVVDRMATECISWEGVLALWQKSGGPLYESVAEFYQNCLRFNVKNRALSD